MSEKLSNILLSICIPTRNQPSELDDLFNVVASQAVPEIEVVVCDDSSDDKTEELVKKYANRINLNYFRGVRGGIDRAVIAVVEKARGKYIWTFGDDLVIEGAIEKVLQLVKNNPDISFIWVNSRGFGEERPAANLGGDRFFKDANEVLEELSDQISFISATVFDRQKALTGVKTAEKHIGSLFVHSYFVLSAISQGGRFYYLSHPYVTGRAKLPDQPLSVDSSRDVFKVFAENFYKVVTDSGFREKFSRKSIKKMLAGSFGSLWRGVLVARAKGYTTSLGSKSPKLKIMFRYYWSFPEFWVALPLFLVPRSLVMILYKLYKKVFKETRLRLVKG